MYDIEEDEQNEDISGGNKLTSGCEKIFVKSIWWCEWWTEIRIKWELKPNFRKKALDDVENIRQITRNLINDENEKNDGKTIRANEDGGYAGTYAHFLIHHEMLSDTAQTEAYRNAICNNLHQMKDKNVLDLGCGTGILLNFCAKAGAKSLTGVDMSDIIYTVYYTAPWTLFVKIIFKML